jgi:septal ring factor EnvC (AmiA/AmiB activator)
MSTLTVFGNYSKRQHQMARLEDYTRAIAHLEASIERVKVNYQNGLDYIKKLKDDRETTQDELQLKQIEVDLKYLQTHFDPTEMNQKIEALETKLVNHRIRLQKLHEKHAVKTPAERETA